MGDLNRPEVNWQDETTKTSENHPATLFLEAVRDSFLTQHSVSPTHYKPNCIPSCIDLIFTNGKELIDELESLAPLGKSHHVVQKFKLKCCQNGNPCNIEKYQYNKANFEEIREGLSNINWKIQLNNKNVNEMWEELKSTVGKLIDKHVPKSKPKSSRNFKRRPLWMTPKSLAAVKKKQHAFKRYLLNQEGKDYDAYAKARNQARWKIRKAKREYEKLVISQCKSNPKAFYKYANSKLKSKTGVPDLLKQDGEVTQNDKEKAETLNEFFASVFTKEDTQNIPDFSPNKEISTLSKLNVVVDKVLKCLQNLNPSKASGPDGFHPRLLKETCHEMALPLTIIFNKSIEDGDLPEDWKCAQVSPIFKKGNKSLPCNYRPISLTSVVCKVMEGIIREKLLFHMKPHLSEHQHGFLNGRSCMTQLLDCVDEWTKQLDDGNSIDVIFLDYAKAFDSVPHMRLLKKLEGYGIRGNILHWIKNFLLQRKQRVSVNGETSAWKEVLSGIPQGSVLGPVLFICYVNDMPDEVDSPVRMFADDTKIFSKCNDLQQCEKLQKDLDTLQAWANKWQLRFNAAKCKCMHLGHKNSDFSYHMKESGRDSLIELEKTSSEKDLGVYMDPKLKFSDHCQKSVSKANQILGLIRRSFDYIDEDAMKQLFKGLVRPNLEYANSVWHPRLKKDIALIENVQRRATRMIPSLKNLNYEDRLKYLGLPSLAFRRVRGDLIETFKITHGFYDIDQEKYFHLNEDTRTRGHSFKLLKMGTATETRKHFFSNRVIDLWNSLPAEAVEATSMNCFKNQIDKALSKHLFSAETDIPTIVKDLKQTKAQ